MTVLYVNSSIHAIGTTLVSIYKMCRRMAHGSLFDVEEPGAVLEGDQSKKQTSTALAAKPKVKHGAREGINGIDVLTFTLSCTWANLRVGVASSPLLDRAVPP